MIVNKKLSSGIELVIEKIPYVRSVAIGIWIKAGSINENEQNSGISHFIEHMLFKGTQKRNAREIAGDIDKIGGQINAFTGKESTCYYVKVLDTHVEDGVEILMDMLFNSKFDKDEMEKEKTVIYEEINMYEDSPEDTVHDMLSEIIFDGHPLAKPIIGNYETISGFSRNMILDYIKENYGMNNITISVSGNFDEEKLIDILNKNIAKHLWEKKVAIPEMPDYNFGFKMKKKDIEQAHICMGIKGIPLDHENYYALSVLSNIMGGSMSSRLFQRIREEKGLAYSVYSYTTSYVNDGVFAIYAGVNPKQLKEASKLMIEEINILREKGVLEEELKTAKEQLKGNYILSLESVSGRMASIGKSQLLLKKVYTPDEVIESINKVTMEEIKKVTEMVTDVKKYSAAVVARDDVTFDELIGV